MHMKNNFQLNNETALITGGGTGLGFGMAKCMVSAGARVVLVGRRETELKKAASRLGASASYVPHDVTKLSAAPELINEAERVAGAPVSILVNNAGMHLKKAAHETTPDEFRGVLETHVFAAHALVAAALPGMLARRQGTILFTASMTAIMGSADERGEVGVADGIRTRNNKLHKLGLYH